MKGKLLQYLVVAVLRRVRRVWDAGAGPDFDERVAPLLSERCLDCHSGGKPKGGLDLRRRARRWRGVSRAW